MKMMEPMRRLVPSSPLFHHHRHLPRLYPLVFLPILPFLPSLQLLFAVLSLSSLLFFFCLVAASSSTLSRAVHLYAMRALPSEFLSARADLDEKDENGEERKEEEENASRLPFLLLIPDLPGSHGSAASQFSLDFHSS